MKKNLLTLLTLTFAVTAAAQSYYEVEHVGPSINTTGSESGAVVVDDSVLLYSSMAEESSSRIYMIDFNPLLTQVFQAPIAADGTLGEGVLNQWGFNGKGSNTANVAFDPKNNIMYFTRAAQGNTSHIYYSKRTGRRWGKALPLGGDVNQKGYTSTHPSVGYLEDGKTILYFSSDRPGGLGGMDIWYTILIKEGVPGNCTNLGAPVNSDSNDVTPFYCNEEGRLYFSSTRTGGLGGFDIYAADGQRNSWQLPRHLGKEVNSPHNDLYFTMQPCRCRCVQDSGEVVEACGFLASNRNGSLYATESNCCNDLFRWRRLRKKVSPTPAPRPLARESRAADLLPLSLYFHNDEPNPHTLDTTTESTYSQTWQVYVQLREEYKASQPSFTDPKRRDSVQWAVEFFFDSELGSCRNQLQQLMQLLYQDLRAGHKVRLTLNGYASPLFESEYNVNLSKRRVACVKNELKAWNDNALLPYLNNGSLKLEMASWGAAGTDEVAASDPLRNPKRRESVYSLDAAMDRRVVIIGYEIVTEKE